MFKFISLPSISTSNYLIINKMRKITFLTIAILLIIVASSYGQTLVNALIIKPTNLELNGVKLENKNIADRMIIASNKTKIILYEDSNITYWGEFRYHQCGKKAKLKSKTYVELSDGKVINGTSKTTKYKMEEGKPGWFYEKQEDEFETDHKNNLAFKANLEYTMRYKN